MTLEQWQEEAVKEKELWQTPLEDFIAEEEELRNFAAEIYFEISNKILPAAG